MGKKANCLAEDQSVCKAVRQLDCKPVSLQAHKPRNTAGIQTMKHILLTLLSLCFLCTTAIAQVFDLRCEGLQAPLGIETTTPHFSWKNTLTHNNQKQKAYEIQIASDSAALAKDHADIWKSGRIESDEQIMVAYTGTSLQERQLYYWRVRTWDEN